jgi:hypothetical protein
MYVSASVYVADSKRVRSQKQSNNKGTKREKLKKEKRKKCKAWGKVGAGGNRERPGEGFKVFVCGFVVVRCCCFLRMHSLSLS